MHDAETDRPLEEDCTATLLGIEHDPAVMAALPERTPEGQAEVDEQNHLTAERVEMHGRANEIAADRSASLRDRVAARRLALRVMLDSHHEYARGIGVPVPVPAHRQPRVPLARGRRTCGARRRPGGPRRVSRSASSGDPGGDSEPGEARPVAHPSPRPIGDVLEGWIADVGGPARLAAFHALPQSMQDGAWAGLRAEIERQREEGGQS